MDIYELYKIRKKRNTAQRLSQLRHDGYITEEEYQALKDMYRNREEQEPTSPCDSCRYNPPGSGNGKPCTMCPADATERFREKVKSEYFRRREEV